MVDALGVVKATIVFSLREHRHRHTRRTHGHTYTPQHTTTHIHSTHIYTYTAQHSTTQHSTTQTNHFTTSLSLVNPFPPLPLFLSPYLHFILPRFLPSLFPFLRPHTYAWSFDVVLCICPRCCFTEPWRLWQQCMNLEHDGLSCARPFESAVQQRTSGGRLFGVACRRSQGITTH